uniref:Uncharacterized protein n=1 Tax=Schistocephalus solidus TaxID=70667 RepID=A0A0X3NR27_SCHSO
MMGGTYFGEISRNRKIRLHEHQMASRRIDSNSQFATHNGKTGRRFDLQGTAILDRGTSITKRLTLEAWYPVFNSIKRHIDFPVAYKVLRRCANKDQSKTVTLNFKNSCRQG